MENGHIEENKLPKICVNDEFISRSPSPVSLQLNNIEKLDSEGLMRKTNSPQTLSILNIADVNKITESVRSVRVKLENLTGVQFFVIERRNVMSPCHRSRISKSQQSSLPTSICIVERWKKIIGYRFVPEEDRTFKEVRQQIVVARNI